MTLTIGGGTRADYLRYFIHALNTSIRLMCGEAMMIHHTAQAALLAVGSNISKCGWLYVRVAFYSPRCFNCIWENYGVASICEFLIFYLFGCLS